MFGTAPRRARKRNSRLRATRCGFYDLDPRLENRRDRAAWQETTALKYEYDGLFDLVSFNFPDPEPQREVDFDLANSDD